MIKLTTVIHYGLHVGLSSMLLASIARTTGLELDLAFVPPGIHATIISILGWGDYSLDQLILWMRYSRFFKKNNRFADIFRK